MSCNKATTSGLQTGDAVIANMPGTLKSVILIADGTNAANVVLYDNASAASGTVLVKLSVPALGTQAEWHIDCGVSCNNGIYADVTGTGAAYIVHYEKG